MGLKFIEVGFKSLIVNKGINDIFTYELVEIDINQPIIVKAASIPDKPSWYSLYMVYNGNLSFSSEFKASSDNKAMEIVQNIKSRIASAIHNEEDINIDLTNVNWS